jgi:hypothetical protein
MSKPAERTQNMTTMRKWSSSLLIVAAVLLVGEARGQDKSTPPQAQKPAKLPAIKCPAKFQCKMPSRGVDYPVCHDGAIPPTCDKQSDCEKMGLGRGCTKVAPFFSICVQACTP